MKEAKLLPTDLQQILDNAHKGVVLVSFGSLLDPSKMDSEKLKVIVNAFRYQKV